MIGCNDDRRRLFLDFETYSSVDIKKFGSFRYIAAPDFEPLLLAFAWDREPVRVLDLLDSSDIHSEDFQQILGALLDPDVVKVAHNAAFEREVLRVYTGHYMPIEQWDDTAVIARWNGLPGSLEGVGAVLNLPAQKLKEGELLIRYFSRPCNPTSTNGGRTRNRPEDAPDKWARFKKYCGRDVEVCQAVYYQLQGPRVPEWEKQVRALDARINERGVLIDRTLASSAVKIDETLRERDETEMQKLTGLEKPNAPQQLGPWLAHLGFQIESVDKAAVADILKETDDPVVRRVLELRRKLSKTSNTKYSVMLGAANPEDDRVRGLMLYYGASRTGRWAGRIVQPQNLPQNHLEDIDDVRQLARSGDLESLELCFDSVQDTLSQLIRTALIAKPGCTFLVADYSAIEARVIAYLAGVKWRQEVFANGGDIYCSSASQMFKVPVVKHGINGELRQKGKVAELACGYGGGVGALINFGADKMGLSNEEMQEIVRQWRAASPEIPRFWSEVEKAAKNAVTYPGHVFRLRCGCEYRRDQNALRLRLPSQRILTYWSPYIDGEGALHFWGQNQTTQKWEDTGTWGGKLTENIVQAYARDCLAVAMLRLDAAGYKICFSVHDELICEEPEGGRTWQEMAEIMGRPIDWAPGLLLRADGYDTRFYKKD